MTPFALSSLMPAIRRYGLTSLVASVAVVLGFRYVGLVDTLLRQIEEERRISREEIQRERASSKAERLEQADRHRKESSAMGAKIGKMSDALAECNATLRRIEMGLKGADAVELLPMPRELVVPTQTGGGVP